MRFTQQPLYITPNSLFCMFFPVLASIDDFQIGQLIIRSVVITMMNVFAIPFFHKTHFFK